MGFTPAELESYRGATLPDLIGAGVRLLFVGINPGLWTAATQTHFNHPGNRFYPALHLAGLIDIVVDRGRAMNDEERRHLVCRGIGITNLVTRATARAAELDVEELRRGADRVAAVVNARHPRVVAVAGITAYRHAFTRPKAVAGRQDERIGAAELWVVPNPSGLNAHETITSLATAYRAAAIAAGIDPLR